MRGSGLGEGAPATPVEVRGRIVEALEADLVGPFVADGGLEGGELLPIAPSRWYLTGFLASTQDRGPAVRGARGGVGGPDEVAEALEVADADEALDDAGLGAGDDVAEEDDGDPDPEPQRKAFFPSSMGLSLLLPPRGRGAREDVLSVTVRWAEYVREGEGEGAHDEGGEARSDSEGRRGRWRRKPERVEVVDVTLAAAGGEWEVPGSGGLRLQALCRRGTRRGSRRGRGRSRCSW